MGFLPKEVDFTKEELLRFANILDNAGQVFLAGMVIAPFFSAVEIILVFVVPFGMFLTLMCWFISWKFTKEATKL